MRTWTAIATAALLLAGCGQDTDVGTGTEPGSTSSSPSLPTAAPWPAYPNDSYTYVLRVSCFCPDAAEPIAITVTGGKVTAAVNKRTGEEAEEYRWLTINDLIDEANDEDAAEVRVTWPDGSDHPRTIYIDRIENAVDDEISYDIRNVQPAT